MEHDVGISRAGHEIRMPFLPYTRFEQPGTKSAYWYPTDIHCRVLSLSIVNTVAILNPAA